MNNCKAHSKWICIQDQELTWAELREQIKPNIDADGLSYVHIEKCLITKCPKEIDSKLIMKKELKRHWLFWKKEVEVEVPHIFEIVLKSHVLINYTHFKTVA